MVIAGVLVETTSMELMQSQSGGEILPLHAMCIESTSIELQNSSTTRVDSFA